MKRWCRKSRMYQTFEAVIEGALQQDHLRAAVAEVERCMSIKGSKRGRAKAREKRMTAERDERNEQYGLRS